MEKDLLAIYDKYADAVFRFCCCRVFERELAKDLMQQSFLKTWEYLKNGNQVENLKSFVFKVARNLIIDHHRAKKENLSIESMLDVGWEIPSKDEDWNLRIDLRSVKELLNNLEDIYSEVLTLRYIEGFGPKEIAKIINETEDVVSVRIHRGLKKMKGLVKKYENL